MKAFDAEGKEIEVFSQEELDAKIAEAKTAFTKETPAPVVPPKDVPTTDGNKEVIDRLARVEADLRAAKISEYSRVYAGNDPQKAEQFKQKFERLTGYEDNEAGIAERAADAAKLAFGNASAVDVSALSGAGTRSVDGQKQVANTQVDKEIQAALGITEADVTKYGNK